MNKINKGVFLSLLLLSACQHKTHQVTQSVPWLQDLSYFSQSYSQFDGLIEKKLSAKVLVKTNNLNEQANMLWVSNADQQTVRLFGPFGAGAVKLTFDQSGAQLQDAKGRLYQHNDAQRLLSDAVGWPIPIDELMYWVFGLPEPTQAYRYQLNEIGQMSVLEQLGWRVEYQQYRQYQQRTMPRKIIASKQLGGELVTVRLVVKSWQW